MYRPNTISSFKFKGLYRIFCILFFSSKQHDGAILILIDERLSVFHGFSPQEFSRVAFEQAV